MGAANAIDELTDIPGVATGSGCLHDEDLNSSVAIDSLDSGTALIVQTRKSVYRMVVVDSAVCKVLVQGGQLLPQAAEGIVQGSSLGGSVLKMGWIVVGLRLELVVDRQRIITSRVESIRVATAHQ